MLKNILFDMDGTLIDCEVDRFIPPYKAALAAKFSAEPEMKKIIETVLTGVKPMVTNDGSRTNREAFIEYAQGRLEMTPETLEEKMTEFYSREYEAVRRVVTVKPDMIEAVGGLKSKGYRLAVTTNPLFPLHALVRRLEWGGYDPASFEFVTSYETSRYAKPSHEYYVETLERLKMSPEETMIVGNDRREDVQAGALAGLTTYYLTDAPIDDGTADAAADMEGKSADFLAFARSLPRAE